MKIENAFEDPPPIDQTWDLLLDIEAIAPCFPDTRVAISTDLNLSGLVAQCGRGAGMIKALGDQIIAEITKRLTAKLGADGMQNNQLGEADSARRSTSAAWVFDCSGAPCLASSTPSRPASRAGE